LTLKRGRFSKNTVEVSFCTVDFEKWLKKLRYQPGAGNYEMRNPIKKELKIAKTNLGS
jgi:hypothetical protein